MSLSNQLLAQRLVITVYDVSDGSVPPAIITFRDLNDTLQIKEFLNIDANRAIYDLRVEYTGLLVTVSSLGYETQREVILQPMVGQTYTLNFRLRFAPNELEQVLVKATRKPYREQGDTISYDVAAYSDGSERKIEEVIKKLPGISVNERSGEIKYKGVPVETVTLDGDNLFDRDYTIGTRNLNADAVEKVEAIDNYNENPVLSGLTADGKVALNLVLKDRAVDFSGSADLGAGVQAQPGPALDVGATLLGIGKKAKSFATLSHNNLGRRQSPYDPFFPNRQSEDDDQQDFSLLETIQLVNPPPADNIGKRMQINAESFGSASGLIKWSPKMTTRLRLTGVKDYLQRNTFYRDDYRFSDTTLLTSDDTDAELRPQTANGNLKLLFEPKQNSRLEYQLDATASSTAAQAAVVRNQTDPVQAELNTTNDRLSQILVWTKRINPSKAIEVKVKHAEQTIRQDFELAPLAGSMLSTPAQQAVDNTAKALRAGTDLIGRWGQHKYRQGAEARWIRLQFGSTLLAGAELQPSNQVAYENASLTLRGNVQFRWSKIRLTPNYELTFMQRTLANQIDNTQLQRFDALIRPNLDLRYDLNRNSYLEAGYSYRPSSELENHLFTEDLLIDQRTLISHEPSLRLQQRQQFGVKYFLNNLRYQFEASASGSYQINAGNFNPELQINRLQTRLRYVFTPVTNNLVLSEWKISKYIAPLRSTILYNGEYVQNRYRNVIGASELRKNTANFWLHKWTWQVSPKIPVSISQTVAIDHFRVRSGNAKPAVNTGFVATTRITSTLIKNIFCSLALETFRPDVNDWSQEITFLDATVRYRPEKRPWQLYLSLANLTNVQEFRLRSVSDAATTLASNQVLPRQLVIMMSRNF